MKLIHAKGEAFIGDGVAGGMGLVKLHPEDVEDLWHAYNIIQVGDSVEATAIRKVKSESSTGSVDSQRIKTTLRIRVLQVDFDPEGGQLRLNGTVSSENNAGVRLGARQTLTLELTRPFTVEKDAWDSVMLARLRESVADASERADLWAVLIRDGLAQLCVVTGGMTIVKARLETHIAKKGDARVLAGAKKQREHWFEQLLSAIIRHVRFDRLKCAVLAGPGFTKDAFWEWMCEQSTKRELRELLLSQPKWLLVHASSAYKHAIKEILGDPTVAQQVADTRAGREVKALADFMGYMAEQPDRVTYGLRFVQLAAEQGAIATLLLVDSLFRAQNIARRAEHVALAEAAEAAGATVLIFSDQHVSGAQLKQLSGVAALLRFPLPLDQLDELDGLDDDDKGDGGGSDEEASSSSSSSSTSDDERPTERPRAVQAHVAGDGPGAGGEHGGEASSERGWAVGDDGLREAGLEASATKLHVS